MFNLIRSITIVAVITRVQTEKTQILHVDNVDFDCNAKALVNCTSVINKLDANHEAVDMSTDIVNVELINKGRAIITAYQFANNRWIAVPFKLEKSVCDLLASNLFVIDDVFHAGNLHKCPLEAGHVYIEKYTSNGDKIPSIALFGQIKVVIEVFYQKERIAYIAFSVHSEKVK